MAMAFHLETGELRIVSNVQIRIPTENHILPRCDIHTVGEEGFALLTRQLLLDRRRKVSLVDLSSFDCIFTEESPAPSPSTNTSKNKM